MSEETVVNVNEGPVEVNTGETEELISAIPAVVSESKKGWRTTEFWLVVGVSVLTVLNGIPLPEKYEGAVVAALGGLYALSRGLAKQGTPVIEPGNVPSDLIDDPDY
ncbi:MAG: hypothetical protein H0T60_02525 [Acidobacteria bacterium]|nr:hypothetical protein [Acidobacteriota bacterium]